MRKRGRSSGAVLAFSLLALLPCVSTPAGADDDFLRGDSNTTGEVDIADPISTLTYLFNGGPASSCPDAADSNDDGDLDIGDPITTLRYLFFGERTPPAPGPRVCGPDPTPDRLAACVHPSCGGPRSCLDLSFAGLGGAAAGNAAVEASLSARSRQSTPVYAYLEARLAADAGDSERIVVLERYRNENDQHAFFYARLRSSGDTIDAATNLPVLATVLGPRTEEPGAIVEASVAATAVLVALFDDLEAAAATSGAGGKDVVLDGSTHLLSFERAGSCTQHATYGYRYPVSSLTPAPPAADSDVARYEQNVVAYELWARIFGAPPVLAGAGAGAAAGTGQGICIAVDPADADFQADALAALQAISPCWIYTITPQGQVQIQSPADFEEFCRCFKQHKAGTNLIADLALLPGKTKIEPSGDGNSYDPEDNVAGFDSDSMQGGVNADGNRDRPPAVGLAHELIHALHDRNGTIDLDGSRTDGILDEEITTVRGENQIRGELGEPMRTQYGGNDVPNHTDDSLDESNRYDCPCPESDAGGGDTGGGAVPGER